MYIIIQTLRRRVAREGQNDGGYIRRTSPHMVLGRGLEVR